MSRETTGIEPSAKARLAAEKAYAETFGPFKGDHLEKLDAALCAAYAIDFGREPKADVTNPESAHGGGGG